jgi:hypothetical protein
MKQNEQAETKRQRSSPLHSQVNAVWKPLEFEEYDFTRNPIVEDQAFFLESKCIHCGFAVVASSVEQLLEEEEHHRAHCTFMRAVS